MAVECQQTKCFWGAIVITVTLVSNDCSPLAWGAVVITATLVSNANLAQGSVVTVSGLANAAVAGVAVDYAE